MGISKEEQLNRSMVFVENRRTGQITGIQKRNGEIQALSGGAGGAAQEPADWNAISGVTHIKNKPTILTTQDVDGIVAQAVSGLGGGSGGVATNLSVTPSATNVVVVSSSGDDATLPAATTVLAGLMLPAQVTKLAGLSAGGGGGAPIYRKLTVVANGQTANVLITGYGSTADLALATVTAVADGSVITVAGLPTTFDIKDVTAHTPAGFNTGTAFSLVFACPFATAAIDDCPLPILMHWNIAAPAVEQAQTNINATVVSGVITVQKTGLTAGTGARWKAVL